MTAMGAGGVGWFGWLISGGVESVVGTMAGSLSMAGYGVHLVVGSNSTRLGSCLPIRRRTSHTETWVGLAS